MFDGIYTRKDGRAFGLERSGYKVPTRVKDRHYSNKIESNMNIKKWLLDEKQNPLLKKKVRQR